MSQYNSVLIDSNDNVITTLQKIEAGQQLNAIGLNEFIITKQDIPKGHKVSIRDINKGEKVFKYGEHIGTAVSNISIGEHVHIHNIKSNRGKELKEE